MFRVVLLHNWKFPKADRQCFQNQPSAVASDSTLLIFDPYFALGNYMVGKTFDKRLIWSPQINKTLTSKLLKTLLERQIENEILWYADSLYIFPRSHLSCMRCLYQSKQICFLSLSVASFLLCWYIILVLNKLQATYY